MPRPTQAARAGQRAQRCQRQDGAVTDPGPVRVEAPRDRDGSFKPIPIPKHERHFIGIDERIIAMYARGMSVRETQAVLAESYGTAVSPDLISSVTISTACPRTTVQTCIVHLINSLEYASHKDRKVLAAALHPIHAATKRRHGRRCKLRRPTVVREYPTIVQPWQRPWEHVVPFYVFPPEIRRVVYTTNATESLNMQLQAHQAPLSWKMQTLGIEMSASRDDKP